MSVVRISGAITAINTFVTGAQTPSADTNGSAVITVTPAEASILCTEVNKPKASSMTNPATGAIKVKVPGQITTDYDTADKVLTSMTINAHAYTNGSDFCLDAVAAVDANTLIAYGFKLVTG